MITIRPIIRRSRQGFTLIELLVVISIIGVLASVVLASLNSARQKARNARRVSDLHQIALALEMYYDSNNSYPTSGNAWRSQCASWGNFPSDQVIPGLVPAYMPVFPSDPSMNTATSLSCYLYGSFNGGADYAVLDHNGPDIIYASQPLLEDPGRDGGSNPCVIDGGSFWSWKISSPGGRCW